MYIKMNFSTLPSPQSCHYNRHLEKSFWYDRQSVNVAWEVYLSSVREQPTDVRTLKSVKENVSRSLFANTPSLHFLKFMADDGVTFGPRSMKPPNSPEFRFRSQQTYVRMVYVWRPLRSSRDFISKIRKKLVLKLCEIWWEASTVNFPRGF